MDAHSLARAVCALYGCLLQIREQYVGDHLQHTDKLQQRHKRPDLEGERRLFRQRSNHNVSSGVALTQYDFNFGQSFNSQDQIDLDETPELLAMYLQG